MGIALGWIAIALSGVAASPHPERDRSEQQLTYTVRMVEADGVGWRETVFSSMKPVTRQGCATVWTVPRDCTPRLVAAVCKNATAPLVQAPKVTAFCGAPATIQCRQTRPMVTQVAWNGTENAAQPATEKLRVGWHTTIVGRKLDQGVLVQLVLEDTVVRAVHQVTMKQPAEAKCTSTVGAASAMPQMFVGHGKAAGLYAFAYTMASTTKPETKKPAQGDCTESSTCCEATKCDAKEAATVQKVVFEVPEIDTQEVAGEWLIPRGEMLLVSLGAHTMADASGRAVVKERLAMIEAAETTDMSHAPTAAIVVPFMKPVAPVMNMPMPNVAVPALPSRSFPQGVHADGTPADLPPLPADEKESDASTSESAEPMPSPQTKKPTQAKPATDNSTNKVEFSFPKAASAFFPSAFMPTSLGGFQFAMPIKPMTVRLPFGQKLEVEIFGKIVPETSESTK